MSGFPFAKEAVKHLFSKPSTELYPVVKKEAPENYRGRIAFHPDKCRSCGLCIRVCAPSAITKTVEEVEDGELITMSFNMSSCTFCQYCSDFCGSGAIEFTKDYCMVVTDESDLIVSDSFLKKRPAPKDNPAPESCPIV